METDLSAAEMKSAETTTTPVLPAEEMEGVQPVMENAQPAFQNRVAAPIVEGRLPVWKKLLLGAYLAGSAYWHW